MVFLLAALSVAAQPHHGNRDRRARLEKLTVEQIADLQTKRLILALELNEKQGQDVYQLHLDQAEKLKARMQQRKTEEKPASLGTEDWYQRETAKLDEQIAYQQSMKDILSKEQYEAFRRMHRERKKARAGKRMPRDGRSR